MFKLLLRADHSEVIAGSLIGSKKKGERLEKGCVGMQEIHTGEQVYTAHVISYF